MVGNLCSYTLKSPVYYSNQWFEDVSWGRKARLHSNSVMRADDLLSAVFAKITHSAKSLFLLIHHMPGSCNPLAK